MDAEDRSTGADARAPRAVEACPVCGTAELKERPERLRDSDAIGVRECTSCGHVFLASFAHIDDAYFERSRFLMNKDFIQSIRDRLNHYEHENQERAGRIGPLVVNRSVLDFGCGAGALMEKIKPLVSRIEGVEPTQEFRSWLHEHGWTVYETLEDAKGPYDAVLMFHVLEHLPDPVKALSTVRGLLADKGLLYIEVPNVNDALIKLYDVDAARRFLFFKDHLQYFTRASLTETIRRAGLKLVTLRGHNRFGLANHLYWLSHGKPGGHKIWSFLETPSLYREYAQQLASADLSDSLIAEVTLAD